MLGVPQLLLTEHGAVSEPVARAMAEGALAASDAELAVAVTGVAGPGGSDAKPEGLVLVRRRHRRRRARSAATSAQSGATRCGSGASRPRSTRASTLARAP